MSNVVFKFHILETFLKFLFSYSSRKVFFIVKENYISAVESAGRRDWDVKMGES